MSRYAYIYTLRSGLAVGEGSWMLEVNKEKQTVYDGLTLPLETVPFAGKRATTVQGLAERGWSVALTGQAATTAKGTLAGAVSYYIWSESFTGSNNDPIDNTHSTDDAFAYSWDFVYGTTAPTIQSNRARGNTEALLMCKTGWVPSVAHENDLYMEADFYRRTSTNGTTSDIPNAGLLFRGTAPNGDGYVVGYNELDDKWVLVKYSAGTPTLLADQTGYSFGGTGVSQRVRVRVYTFSGTYDVHIEVDIISGFDWQNMISYDDYGSSYGGPYIYDTGVAFAEVDSIELDNIIVYHGNGIPHLTGHRLASASGTVVDHFRTPSFPRVELAQGILAAGTGGTTEQALTGLAATTAYGTITPEIGAIIVELTGEDAVTAQGALGPTHVVVADQAIGALAPRVAWTYYTNTSDQNPGNIGTQFLPWSGVLYGAGNEGRESILKRFPRAGLKRVSQITEETYPWTANPSWTLSDNAGMAIEDPTAPVSNALSYGKLFPRGAFGEATDGYRYTTAYSKGGWLTITTGGYIWSAVERVHDRNNGVSVYLAPHPGEIKDGTSYYYNGPELFTGRSQPQGQQQDPLRQTYYNTAPMGLYPLSENEVLAFYPQIIDGQITGKFADLVGSRLITQFDPPTAGYTGSDGAALQGFAITTAAGVVGNDGPDKYVTLTGHVATPSQGFLYARDANVVPAFRRLKGGVWQDTPVVASSFSGADRVWARSHYMTVIPSGYGDLIYVAYYSEGWAAVGPKVGLVVMDAASGVVTSNTLYSVATTPFTRFKEGDTVFGEAVDELTRPWGPHRTVALTHKLSSGTHVTQFLLAGQVVHVSWTSGARTTPTVTIKDGVSLTTLKAAYPAWESLEIRGDNVYHVVPTGSYSNFSYDGGVETLYVNDATGTSSTWTTPTLSTTTSGTKDGTREIMVWYGGYGGGRKSWWYLHWWDSVSGTERGNDTGWFDAWYSQPKLISVSGSLHLGRVTLQVVPNVDLTGLRATTGTDHIGLFPLVGGDKVARLTGKRLTAKTVSGKDFPAYNVFVYDNFTYITSEDGTLADHVADTGHTWLESGTEIFVLNTIGEAYCTGTTIANKVVARVNMTTPSNDYCVKGRFSYQRSVTYQILNVINEGIGARIFGSNGYFFGYNLFDGKWYLTKQRPDPDPDAFPSQMLAEYVGPWSSEEFAISVTGSGPVRIRCYVNDIEVIDYTDTTDVATEGVPGFCCVLGSTNHSYFTYINAGVHDATLTILTGERATTARGTFFFGLEGKVATTAQGELFAAPSSELTGQVATAVGGYIEMPIQVIGLSATAIKGPLYTNPGDAVLEGFVATTAQGAFPINATIGLIHGHLDTHIGIITIPIVEAPGLRTTLAQGVMGFDIDQAPEQTGLVAATTQGMIVPEIGTPALTGQIATGDLEPPIPHITAPAWSWGLYSQARQGVLGRFNEDIVALTGNAASMQQGLLTPLLEDSSATTGQAATTTIGSLTPKIEVPLFGMRSTSGSGVLSVSLIYALTGQSTATAYGQLAKAIDVFLTGDDAATALGTLGVQYGGSVTAAGFEMRLYLGSVTEDFKKPSADLLLWAVRRTEELFVQEIPDDENPVVAPNE